MAKAHKLPSGTWRCVASWTDELGNHKQKSFTAPSKQEAEFLASKFLTEKKHSMKPENKTLDDLITSFIDNRSNLLSPTTILNYDKIRRTAFPSITSQTVTSQVSVIRFIATPMTTRRRSPKMTMNRLQRR